MSLILPSGSDTLLSKDHAFLHRVIAVDSAASEQSVTVNSASQLCPANGIKFPNGSSITVAPTTPIPLTYLDTDGTMASDSDAKVPSQKAVVTYVAAHGGTSVTRGTFNSASLTANILTITHSLGLSSPYPVVLSIFNNLFNQVIPDAVVGGTNSVTVNLASFATISGTWGYAIVAG